MNGAIRHIYNPILIERYCMNHNFKKSRQLDELLRLSYNLEAAPDDDDTIFLEKVIRNEKNPELKEALQDLDEFLFG